MISLARRHAVYIPTSPRPSSKIFEFFGISPSASPSSSLRQLLSGQGTGRSTPCQIDYVATGPGEDAHNHSEKHQTHDQGWSHTEAYKIHKMTRTKEGCFRVLVRNFGPIWFAIPLNAGFIGLLLRQILLHVLIPTDVVQTTNGFDLSIKAATLQSTRRPFKGQRALQTISTVFFFIDLVTFTIFSLIFILRLLLFRRAACRDVLGLQHDRVQGENDVSTEFDVPAKASSHATTDDIGYLSLWPTAWLTLVTFAVAIIPEAIRMDPPHGNISAQKLTYLAYITWWIGAAWTATTTVHILGVVVLSQPSRNDTTPTTNKRPFSPSLLFVPVALATLVLVGSLLVSDLLIPSAAGTKTELFLPGLAMMPVIIFSFCALGAALFLSLILYPVILLQGMFPLLPDPGPTPVSVGQMALMLFFFIGPVSQCAVGLQLLGGTLSGIPGGSDGTSYDITGAAFLTNTAPTLISVPCILLALLLFGMAVVWFLLALVGMGYAATRRELRWTPEWHGIILPLSGLALSALQFGAELDSSFFRVVACVLLVVVVVGFVVYAGLTLWFAVAGWRKMTASAVDRADRTGHGDDEKVV